MMTVDDVDGGVGQKHHFFDDVIFECPLDNQSDHEKIAKTIKLI